MILWRVTPSYFGQKACLPRVFLELVQTGEGTKHTRRRAVLGEVREEARGLVKKLADARLVVHQ